MKRIAIFSITYLPFIGGAEIAIKEVSERLPQYEFDLFTARLDAKLPPQEKIGNVNVYRLGSGRPGWDKWFYPWRAARLALARHRQNPYALAHAVLETYAGLAALFFKKREPTVPYILTLQSGDSDSFLWKRIWFWYPLYRQIYTGADKITSISQWLAQRAAKFGHQGEIVIIPNGVDFSHFFGEMNQAEKNFIRQTWGLKKDDFVLVTASRLVHKNGIDILIDSLRHLPEDVKLVIAGSGEEEEKLKSSVACPPTGGQLPDRVVFLGQIEHAFLPKVLQAADVFVRASRSEGLGNAFLEAMAAGLPVIGAAVGGIVDFIEDGKTGLLVPPDDAEGLAGAIRKLRTDEKLRRDLAQRGQRLVRGKYDWPIIASAYQKVYESF